MEEATKTWTDLALCASSTQVFTYLEPDDPGYEPRKNKYYRVMGTRGSNRLRLLDAAETCASCPVRQECLDNADPSDRYWSIRGGNLPELYLPDSRDITHCPTSSVRDHLPDVCSKGHNDWRLRVNPGRTGERYCGTCNNASSSGTMEE